MFRLPLLSTLLLSLLAAPVAAQTTERFAPYQARNGHDRPLIAVVGDNAGTELTDFVVPYAVLQRSGAADVLAVATHAGPMQMSPALRLRPDTDLAGFDTWHPEGADYVIVPALVRQDEPALLAWIGEQHAKGATILSICDGALVVARTGLLEGHRATAHWATEGHRRKTWPGTDWVANTRYVVDGRMASSAGISASIPVSLALVEAIAGRERALQVGASLGVTEWGITHDTAAFGLRPGNVWPLVKVNATNALFHPRRRFEIALQPAMDDLALALTADAWTRTGRGRVRGVSPVPEVQGSSGLIWYAEPAAAGWRVESIALAGPAANGTTFDALLAAIAHRYDPVTALGVALDFEYAWRPAGL